MRISPPFSTLVRETGLGLAALAVWLLVLLSPLHQTAGLLRAFAETGHDIAGARQICVTLAQDDGFGDHLEPVCPVQVLAKTLLDAPPGGSLPLLAAPAPSLLVAPVPNLVAGPSPAARWAEPRAPPAFA